MGHQANKLNICNHTAPCTITSHVVNEAKLTSHLNTAYGAIATEYIEYCGYRGAQIRYTV